MTRRRPGEGTLRLRAGRWQSRARDPRTGKERSRTWPAGTLPNMPHRPRLLDLFCCAGGAAKGYHDAGFDIVGVDIEHQPDYPYEFHQADALAFPFDGFDAIHASPTCQTFSIASAFHPGTKDKYPAAAALIDSSVDPPVSGDR